VLAWEVSAMGLLSRFWKSKKSLKELLRHYEDLGVRNEVYSSLYEEAKRRNNVDREVETAQKLLDNRVGRIETFISICEIYCPTTAKRVRKILGRFKDLPQHDFLKERKRLMENAEIRSLPKETRDEMIDDLTRSNIKNALDFLSIHSNNIELVSSAIMETMKTLERPYILQKNEYLRMKLNQLGENFLALYDAAWKTFESDNPDRARQCCATVRELLNDLLDVKGKGKDRREKLSFILRNQDATFAEAFTEYIVALFYLLGKSVHRKKMNPNEVTFALTMLEDALLFLLAR